MKNLGIFLPLVSFTAYIIKILIAPPTIADALVLGILVSYIVFDQLRLKDKTLQAYDTQLVEVKEQHRLLLTKIEAVQGGTNAVKAAMLMRPTQGNKF